MCGELRRTFRAVCRSLTPVSVCLLCAGGLLALGARAGAIEGEFTPETREKLAHPVTIEEEKARVGDVIWEIAEQSGLSFAVSLLVAKLPERVAVVARDAPAGEVIEAVAFSMNLDLAITPGGVVSLRLDDDDPRREALLRHLFPPPPGRSPKAKARRGEPSRDRDTGHEGGGAGRPTPRLDEREIVERVADHPKVRALLDELDAELVPERFHPEKRVWVLLIRREDEDEDEEEEPLGRVIASEDGGVMHIKRLRKDKRRHREREGLEPRRREQF